MIPIRDENPVHIVPFVTIGILAVNIAVFLLEIASPDGGEGIIRRFGAIPFRLASGGTGSLTDYVTVGTSMFLHGGLFHLAGNMLFLWIFGNNVEEHLGSIRFLLFYAFCGAAAAAAHIVSAPGSVIPMIGASGAVAGVMGAYVILFPRARIVTLVFLGFLVQMVRLPAVLWIGIWFLIQFVSAVAGGTAESGGVAWMAHVGGFGAGLALMSVERLLCPRLGGGREAAGL
ncbi:MAG: rhomboid family intramembrane serine protease [Nitrospirae bacterium]|nr:rhomboid family intramembrane serine protease [Nitrospirota bacterium]MBI3394137.1 rhomboid family intramembrane serine protease [Nitrospirota bacterium]